MSLKKPLQKIGQKKKNREHTINKVCSFSYFMTHDCRSCKRSAICEKIEDRNDSKKNKSKTW